VIIGTHFLLYSMHAEADRAFFRDILKFPCVDAGEGWLIFAMSPAEAGIHPAEDTPARISGEHPLDRRLNAELYLICDDLNSTIASLRAQKVQCTEVQTAPWGVTTTIPLPSGGAVGLYQPRHKTALDLVIKTSP
jgi:hypothetical protein